MLQQEGKAHRQKEYYVNSRSSWRNCVQMKPKLFVGSSTESLSVAYAIQQNLEHDSEVTVWTQGVFHLSKNALADLITVLNQTEFGVFVFSPDDLVKIRDKEMTSVRDNIVFELGLFIGKLGAERTFFVLPRGQENFHLPSDLVGITPATFDPNRSDRNLQAALGPACHEIRKVLTSVSKAAAPVTAPIKGLEQREVSCLGSMAQSLSGPLDIIYAHHLVHNMVGLGYTPLATNLAIASLCKKRLIAIEKEKSESDNIYNICSITDIGLDWIEQNKQLFRLIYADDDLDETDPFADE